MSKNKTTAQSDTTKKSTATSGEQEDLTTLKFAVKAMGVLLVVGTIALFIAIYIKFNQQPAAQERYVTSIQKTVQADLPKEVATIVPPVVAAPKSCDFKPHANIELSGKVMNSIRNGNTLTLITEKTLKPAVVNKVQEGNSLTLTAEAAVAQPQQIIVFDLCEGEIISRIDVVEEK